jgi:hypothetical protein
LGVSIGDWESYTISSFHLTPPKKHLIVAIEAITKGSSGIE